MTPIPELSSFHSWCDRWCERCPLARSCPIPGASGDVVAKLAEACAMLEEICEREGIDTANLEPPPPLPLEAQLLRQAGMAYGVALCDLGADGVGGPVATKAARLASYFGDQDSDSGRWIWEADAVPNLLLVERLLADARDEIARRRVRARRDLVARAEEAGRAYERLVAPLIDSVPEEARRILRLLIAAGQAPSPFARRPEAGPAGPGAANVA